MPILYIVVPCYNEEEVLPESARVLRMKLLSLIAAGKADAESRLLLVDDGSRDSTWSIISRLWGKMTASAACAFPKTAAIKTPCWQVLSPPPDIATSPCP